MLPMLDNEKPSGASKGYETATSAQIVRDRAVNNGEIAKAICRGADCARCTFPQLGVGTVVGFFCACCAPEAFAAASDAMGAKGEVAMVTVLAKNPKGADGRTARERGILAIHTLQTASEVKADATHALNGAGWQKRDAAFGGDLARQIEAGWTLSERQSHYAFRLLLKYGGQLATIAAARAARRAPEAPAPAPEAPVVEAPVVESEPAKPAKAVKAKKPTAKKATARKSKAPARKAK